MICLDVLNQNTGKGLGKYMRKELHMHMYYTNSGISTNFVNMQACR